MAGADIEDLINWVQVSLRSLLYIKLASFIMNLPYGSWQKFRKPTAYLQLQ
jgi:hypothetical protein